MVAAIVAEALASPGGSLGGPSGLNVPLTSWGMTMALFRVSREGPPSDFSPARALTVFSECQRPAGQRCWTTPSCCR